MPRCIHTPSIVQLCKSNTSTCVRTILQELQLSWRGARDQGGGYNPPALNTCRPSIKWNSYQSTIIHIHTSYQSILPKVMIDRTKKRKNQCICKYFIDSVNKLNTVYWSKCVPKLDMNTTWCSIKNRTLDPPEGRGGYSTVFIPAGPIAPIGTQWHVFYLPLSLNTISFCLKNSSFKFPFLLQKWYFFANLQWISLWSSKINQFFNMFKIIKDTMCILCIAR
jgi:hypothetical protein